MDGVPGDAGGHGTVRQSEHLVLGSPLLLLTFLLLLPSLPLAVGPLLGVLLFLLFGVGQILILFGVVGPKYGCGGPSVQAIQGLIQLLLRLQ